MSATTSKRNPVQWFEFDISQLPATTTRSKFKQLGVLFVVIAVIWAGYYIVAGSSEMGGHGSLAINVLSYVYTIFPIFGLLSSGVYLLVWRRTITVDREFVAVSERNLRGSKKWRERLANYTGVLRRTMKGKNTTFYMIELYHEDKSKRINLYTAPEEDGVRQKWEHYSRVLQLPALEEGGVGTLRRDVEDLDRSVGELIEEGKVDIDFDILEHKAKGLAVDFEDGAVMITRTSPETPWPGIVLAFLFPLPFVLVGLFATPVPWYIRLVFGLAGSIVGFHMYKAAILDITRRQKLRIGPRAVETVTLTSKGEKIEKQVPIGDIESVTVSSESRRSIADVVIASDRETINFGKNLPRQSLEFVMNTVLAMIAEAGRNGRGG